MRSPYQVLRHLHVTEKAQGLQQALPHKYVFTVAKDATKVEIKQALEAIYPNAKVEKVNTLIRPMKTKRMGRAKPGTTREVKTAYVTLKEGDRLETIE